VFDRFKKKPSSEEPQSGKQPDDTRPALGGFGRRQTPVGGSAPTESPPAPPTNGGFGRRATPAETASPSAPQAPIEGLKKVSQTGAKIAQFLMEAYRDPRGVHVETIVGAAAVLAGEFALRASAPRLPDSGWIAGGPADALMFRGFPDKRITMWQVVQIVVLNTGADMSQLPNMDLVATRASESIGKQFPPKLSVPTEHYPHEFSPNAGPRFRKDSPPLRRHLGSIRRKRHLH
jgi:hypothetical protein